MKKHSAFSLIELSIVILVIGILIAGVTQSSRLIKAFRLQTAINLTTNSPVTGIPNLFAWYETSLDSSFISSQTENNSQISTWYDNNTQYVNKNNAVQSTSANQPLFIKNVFDGAIPAIRFDGVNDNLPFDGTLLANSSYTIFIVEERRSNKATACFIRGSASGTNLNLTLCYDTNYVAFAHFNNDIDYAIPAYTSPIVRMHTFQFSTINGKSYWMNGGSTPELSDSSQTTPVSSYAGAVIGGQGSYYYYGDIGEIIIYNRALKNEERQSIEDYLSKKYKIAIS